MRHALRLLSEWPFIITVKKKDHKDELECPHNQAISTQHPTNSLFSGLHAITLYFGLGELCVADCVGLLFRYVTFGL